MIASPTREQIMYLGLLMLNYKVYPGMISADDFAVLIDMRLCHFVLKDYAYHVTSKLLRHWYPYQVYRRQYEYLRSLVNPALSGQRQIYELADYIVESVGRDLALRYWTAWMTKTPILL